MGRRRGIENKRCSAPHLIPSNKNIVREKKGDGGLSALIKLFQLIKLHEKRGGKKGREVKRSKREKEELGRSPGF